MRLAASMRMPRRSMSPSSSPCGSARRISVSRWVASGLCDGCTGGPKHETTPRRAKIQRASPPRRRPRARVRSRGARARAMVVRRAPSQAPSRREPRERGAGVARLQWPGRTWQPGSGPLSLAIPIVTTEETEGARAPGPGEAGVPGRLVRGDALDVARALSAEGLAGKVDLVYIDPPFASQAEYVHEARLDGPADGRIVRATAYDDRWERCGLGEYLDMLAPRIEALVNLLAPTGTIWVHVDWRAAYLVRLVLDEIVGREGFINEIVWRRAPNLGRQAQSHQFGRTLDTLVVYGRQAGVHLAPPTRLERIAASAVRWDEEGRPFTAA